MLPRLVSLSLPLRRHGHRALVGFRDFQVGGEPVVIEALSEVPEHLVSTCQIHGLEPAAVAPAGYRFDVVVVLVVVVHHKIVHVPIRDNIHALVEHMRPIQRPEELSVLDDLLETHELSGVSPFFAEHPGVYLNPDILVRSPTHFVAPGRRVLHVRA